jgi:hypothetical protein
MQSLAMSVSRCHAIAYHAGIATWSTIGRRIYTSARLSARGLLDLVCGKVQFIHIDIAVRKQRVSRIQEQNSSAATYAVIGVALTPQDV